MQFNPQNIFEFIQIITLLSIMILGIRFYFKYKYASIRYFLYALLLFGTRAYLFIVGEVPGTNDVRFVIGSLTSDLIVIILSLYCLLLFFESFSSESPYTKRNLILAIFISAIFSSLIVLNAIVRAELSEISTALIRLVDLDPSMFRESSLILLAIFALFTTASLLLILIEGIFIFRMIEKKRKRAVNEKVRKIFNSFKKSSILIGISIIIFPFFEQFARIALFVMLVYMGTLLLKGGIFIFRDDTLRLLIVIDDSGIPSYTYRFREPLDSEAGENDEMLFSGALKAVSLLFANLTGTMDVKEIVLEGAHLVIKRSTIAKRDVSVVLITDRSSKFYDDAITVFSEKFPMLMVPANEFEVITGEKKQKIDHLVEQLFGILK